jgi:hypothetical protein
MENNLSEYIESGEIEVLGARMHNLKNIDVNIPRNQLVTITGLEAVKVHWLLIPYLLRGNVGI